jgi:hypothetical protein
MNRRQRRAAEARRRKQGGGYLGRLLASQQNLSPGVHHVFVEHDDGCPIFQGGSCTCTPNMHRHTSNRHEVEVIEIDGSVTRMRTS